MSAPETLPENPSVPESAGEPAKASLVTAPPGTPVPAASSTKPAAAAILSQPLQTLVSPQASYAQKQAAWKQLRDTRQLNEAIADLERAAKDDPSVAEYSAVLGQAYLQKLMTTQDAREKIMLAMQADQSFDQALKLDPSNWEARFSKAVGPVVLAGGVEQIRRGHAKPRHLGRATRGPVAAAAFCADLRAAGRAIPKGRLRRLCQTNLAARRGIVSG